MTEKNEVIADAIYDLSKSIRLLGNGNIARDDLSPGAIEGLAMLIRDSNKDIASALESIANSIQSLAESIDQSK